MNRNILDKLNVLSLNALWQRIAHSTVGDAFVAMNGGNMKTRPALGMDIGYAQLADGSWDTSTALWFNPVEWEQWIQLPVRPFDDCVRTAKLTIRVPTVMISPDYKEMPTREPEFSRENVYERDGGVCQVSGRFVGREGGNLEHVHPKGRGGAHRDFRNVVWCSVSLNSQKGDRTLAEMGWNLIRTPVAPKRVPVSATARMREIRHPDWRHFIEKVA